MSADVPAEVARWIDVRRKADGEIGRVVDIINGSVEVNVNAWRSIVTPAAVFWDRWDRVEAEHVHAAMAGAMPL